MDVGRYELTEVQWRRIESLLPGRAGTVGRIEKDYPRFVHGVRWGAAFGACAGKTCRSAIASTKACTRFTRWVEAGVLERVFKYLLQDHENRYVMIDFSVVRVHLRPPRPEKWAPETDLGRSRGGLTTKFYLPVNELGLPLAFHLTGGQT